MVLLSHLTRHVLAVASSSKGGSIRRCPCASPISEPGREMHESDSDQQHQENDHRNNRECLTGFG
jgi:hypothetical protein